MILNSDFVSLRQFAYAIKIAKGWDIESSVHAVFNFCLAFENETFKVSLYQKGDAVALKIEGDSRSDDVAEFTNVHWWDVDFQLCFHKEADLIGISMVDAASSIYFVSPEYFQKCYLLSMQEILNFHYESQQRWKSKIEQMHDEEIKKLNSMYQEEIEGLCRSHEAEIDELVCQIESSVDRPIFHTHLMRIAIEVQKNYWADASLLPKQDVIISEIKERYGLAGIEAAAVEKIACPYDRTPKKMNLP